MKVKTATGDVNLDVGLGVFRRMNVIIGCLDNRLARRSVNRACFKVGKTWIDGGIGDLSGQVGTFAPGQGACYECTLTQAELPDLSREYSCTKLGLRKIQRGRIPTTPTVSAIIAGVQCQEALKILHGTPVPGGKAFFFQWRNQ